MLRKAKVVGKFVEFHGEGAASLPVTDRATIGNMAPEYGATMGFFPVDEQTCNYLMATGRTDEQVDAVRNYFQAQGMFGIPRKGECNYSTLLELNLAEVEPSVRPATPAGSHRAHPLKERFTDLLGARFRERL
ncbi:MAG: aconitase family protein [Pyrinomonadaceae bacterium]